MYNDDLNRKFNKRLQNIMLELPKFCQNFLLSIAQSTSILTRLNYATDLKLFFLFLCENYDQFKNKTINNIDISDLNTIKPITIDHFLDYVTYYSKKNKYGKDIDYQNSEKGKARKLSAIKSLYNYLCKREIIFNNPAIIVKNPKIHDKPITYLEPDEVARLLDLIEEGTNLTLKQKKYHEYTKKRDFAIISLMLGTGIRISECVGINISHIDFSKNAIKIKRKGGNEEIIYFGDEVYDALNSYLKQRKTISTLENNDDALFLSLQRKRLNVRSIQNLVKKYSSIITPLKKITPHKLRSTYGTNLYEETGDIYLVADALGHSDVNTTKKHYAKIKEENRKIASKVIKLRT